MVYGENASPNKGKPQLTPVTPPPGTLFADTSRGDRVGEFQGVSGPYWSLRPVGGGREWEVEPCHVRPMSSLEGLRVRNARLNARSRGEVL